MRLLQQSLILIRANIGSMGRRMAISLSLVLSVALVVLVLIAFLSMARGLEAAMERAGDPAIAVVLSVGTMNEKASEIDADTLRVLSSVPADAAGLAGPTPAISPELIVPVDAPRKGDSAMQTFSLRGMNEAGAALRHRAAITEGRLFALGSQEIVVGERLAADFEGLDVGDEIAFGATRWTVVGHFSDGGSAFESEAWADLVTTQTLFDRPGLVESVRLPLAEASATKPLQAWLDENLNTQLSVVSEKALYAAQSESTARLIRMFAWPLSVVIAIGATAGALNTMMSSVSDRRAEIATFRAIGFGRSSALLATWAEALVLCAAGIALAFVIGLLVIDGYQAATTAGGARVGFALEMTPDMMLTAGLFALAIGLVGGFLPALVAARLPIRSALSGARG